MTWISRRKLVWVLVCWPVLATALAGCGPPTLSVSSATDAAAYVHSRNPTVADVRCSGSVAEGGWLCKFTAKTKIGGPRGRWQCDVPTTVILTGDGQVTLCGPVREYSGSFEEATTHLYVKRTGAGRRVRFRVAFDPPATPSPSARGSRPRRGPARRVYLYSTRAGRPYAVRLHTARLRFRCRADACVARASGSFAYTREIYWAADFFACTRAPVFRGAPKPGRVAENFMHAEGCGASRLY